MADSRASARFYVFDEHRVLMTQAGALPSELPPLSNTTEPSLIGVYEGCEHHLVRSLLPRPEPPEGYAWNSLRALFLQLEEDEFAMAGRAAQLANFEATHRFCGQCGEQTAAVVGERARECRECGHRTYPRISPVVIVRIVKEGKILLARHHGRAAAFWTILAGFAEISETLEQCVAREVLEECGIEVKNIAYAGSQSWPFPHSLMIAFKAEWAGGEVRPDTTEIAEAAFFGPDELPLVPPPRSIAGRLIQEFVAQSRVAD